MLSAARRSPRKSPRGSPRCSESEQPDISGAPMDVAALYLAFLSSRHLHFPGAIRIFLASLHVLLALEFAFGIPFAVTVGVLLFGVVCPLLVWFRLFRPKVEAVAGSWEMPFLVMGRIPSYPGKSPKKSKIFLRDGGIIVRFSSVYVAHTGHFAPDGRPIFGLYAARKISSGYVLLIYMFDLMMILVV